MPPNPYETSPEPLATPQQSTPYRRTSLGTMLLVLWSLELTLKGWLISTLFPIGPALDRLVAAYPTWNRWTFLGTGWFLMVETIGPGIGVYFLTGSRIRRLGETRALIRTFFIAASAGLLATIGLMVWLELRLVTLTSALE